MLRISIICIIFCWCGPTIGQEKTPFATYDFLSDKVYLEKRTNLINTADSIKEYKALIRWATEHKDFETAITYYSKLTELEPNNAELYYRLGGVNGIRIDEISKFKALPYVHNMKAAFLKAHELDKNHIPTLTALVQVHAKLPGFLGGSFEKAEEYSKALYNLSPIEGLLAQGYIFEAKGDLQQAKKAYYEAFEQLSFLDACEEKEIKAYFENKGRNLSYQIASIGLAFHLSSSKSICALQYYLMEFDVYDNLPKEWVYHKLALLFENINEKEQAEEYHSLAVKINPNFKFK